MSQPLINIDYQIVAINRVLKVGDVLSKKKGVMFYQRTRSIHIGGELWEEDRWTIVRSIVGFTYCSLFALSKYFVNWAGKDFYKIGWIFNNLVLAFYLAEPSFLWYHIYYPQNEKVFFVWLIWCSHKWVFFNNFISAIHSIRRDTSLVLQIIWY